eukprot:g798.t1
MDAGEYWSCTTCCSGTCANSFRWQIDGIGTKYGYSASPVTITLTAGSHTVYMESSYSAGWYEGTVTIKSSVGSTVAGPFTLAAGQSGTPTDAPTDTPTAAPTNVGDTHAPTSAPTAAPTSPLISCTFDSGLCGWTQSTGIADQFDWTVHSGSTTSTSTGPTSGAGGSGSYIYIETSSPRVSGNTATITSGAAMGCALRFSYHMYGATIGKLQVNCSSDKTTWTSAWAKEGAQGTAWQTATVLSTCGGSGSAYWSVTGTTGTSTPAPTTFESLEVKISEAVGEMKVGELKKVDGERLANITGSPSPLNTTLWIQQLNPTATETTITLTTDESGDAKAAAGTSGASDEVSLPGTLAEQLSGVSTVKVFVASTDSSDDAGVSSVGNGQMDLQSRVVSINVRDGTSLAKVAVTQLTSPILIKLYPRNGKSVSDTMTCIWRNESTIGTARPWREEGCIAVVHKVTQRRAGGGISTISDAFVVCECHHLTEFALGERRTHGGGTNGRQGEGTSEGGTDGGTGWQTMLGIVAGVLGLGLLVVALTWDKFREHVNGVFGDGTAEAAVNVLGEGATKLGEGAAFVTEQVQTQVFGTEGEWLARGLRIVPFVYISDLNPPFGAVPTRPPAELQLKAPGPMLPETLARVLLTMRPKPADDFDMDAFYDSGKGLTDKRIPHGTKVEAKIEVGAGWDKVFEIPKGGGNEKKKTFVWQGAVQNLEWTVRAKEGVQAQQCARALVMLVKWGNETKRLSADISITQHAVYENPLHGSGGGEGSMRMSIASRASMRRTSTQARMRQSGRLSMRNNPTTPTSTPKNNKKFHISFATERTAAGGAAFPILLDQCSSIINDEIDGWEMQKRLPIGINDKAWWTKWEEQLLDSDGVLVIDTPAYRKKLADGAKLLSEGKDPDKTDGIGIKREADRIIELRDERGDAFKVFVVDGKNISADSLLRLLKNDTSECNFDGWKVSAKQNDSSGKPKPVRMHTASVAQEEGKEEEAVL